MMSVHLLPLERSRAFLTEQMGSLASGFYNRARLLGWRGDPVRLAWCVGTQTLDHRRSHSTHASIKAWFNAKNRLRWCIIDG